MPIFRDEHVIVIAPGSHTTLAQLGLPESFTPARLRLKTRMFPAQKKGEWEPNKIRKKPKKAPAPPLPALSDTSAQTEGQPDVPASVPAPAKAAEINDDDSEYEEDPISDEGAVWPIRRGAITNWSCFYALMHHVHNLLNAPFHTPILVVGQPCWTAKDHENITQFFFEKFKTPGFAIIDGAQAACYAFGVPNATVIDVGADKADITTVVDFLVDEIGRTRALKECGGETMTLKLHALLKSKGFSRDMCEQLKKSSICEILPSGMPIPGSQEAQNPVSTSPNTVAPAQSALGSIPRGSAQEPDTVDDAEDNEGVIDVASIVARGNTTEYLAKKEAEKAEKLAAKKKGADAGPAAAAAASSAARPVKQRNFERERNSFFYEDHAALDAIKGTDMNATQMAETAATLDEAPKKASVEDSADPMTGSLNGTGNSQQASSAPLNTATLQNVPRRELTVGPERFQAAEGDLLIDLSSAVHRTILANPHAARRADLWDSLIIIGNGARVRGFKEALLQTLNARFIISPSSATIFTSEIPSSFSTPNATNGTNTPQPGQGAPPPPTGVNPLLYAATTASAAHQQHPPHTPQHGIHGQFLTPGMQHPHHQHLQHHQHPHGLGAPPSLPPPPQTHSGHGQTPTTIRAARLPEYFPEWKDAGSEEAAFLGAQVAAKVVFVNDVSGGGGAGSNAKGFMSRSDYNESGPSGIHEFSLS